MINLFNKWHLSELINYSKLTKMYQQGEINTKQYYAAQVIQQQKLNYELLTLGKKPLNLMLQEQNILQSMVKQDKQVLVKALSNTCPEFPLYDNLSLIRQYRVSQYNEVRRRTLRKYKYACKTFLITWSVLYILSFLCQLYYYIEYDIWITSPEVQMNTIG